MPPPQPHCHRCRFCVLHDGAVAASAKPLPAPAAALLECLMAAATAASLPLARLPLGRLCWAKSPPAAPRARVASLGTRAASAQFKNSKRFTVDFMNSKFGGAMPPLVLVTVVKPRDVAWDHAYNANLVDVTPNGFVVEVARLDRDAGWCYELELQWMAYGFATGDEQDIGGGSESTAQQRT